MSLELGMKASGTEEMRLFILRGSATPIAEDVKSTAGTQEDTHS